jgi:hypothetical protein
MHMLQANGSIDDNPLATPKVQDTRVAELLQVAAFGIFQHQCCIPCGGVLAHSQDIDPALWQRTGNIAFLRPTVLHFLQKKP